MDTPTQGLFDEASRNYGINEMKFEYRGYEGEYDVKTGQHIARSCDGDLCLVSVSQSRLRKAIDQLWEALRCLDTDPMRLLDIESMAIPGWIRQWLRSGSSRVDIDRAFATGHL
ncbi:hypothetical protein GGQ85_003673 [Nitrobacter vulgaris]|nr:hypothetical protein [Nitrobacter vulgaris]